MICQCRFIDCNKRTISMWEWNDGAGGVPMWSQAGGIWRQRVHGKSVPFTQSCYEPKTAININYFAKGLGRRCQNLPHFVNK